MYFPLPLRSRERTIILAAIITSSVASLSLIATVVPLALRMPLTPLRHAAPFPDHTTQTLDNVHPRQIRRAMRLQERLKRSEDRTVSLPAIVAALNERAELLQRSVTVTWEADDGYTFEPWTASVTSYPFWLLPFWEEGKFGFAIREDMIRLLLDVDPPSGIVPPASATLLAVRDDDGVLRATMDKPAEAGYVIEDGAAKIFAALREGKSDMVMGVRLTAGGILNASGESLGPLSSLAVGRSDFRGSGGGRIANVRKGLQEYIQGVLVPPGASFSFNRAVRDMKGGGWEDALVIFNGKDLVSYPGGGICQVATTVYRAALRAGFPIEERASHSLYVSYYEKFGVGIDATIFPRRQDLVFVNDTSQYALFQAYVKGTEAFVSVHGAPDGRAVQLEGPYFQANSMPDASAGLIGPPLRSNEIAWIRRIRRTDGTETSDAIRSSYRSIPRSVRERYVQGNISWQ